MFSCGGGWLAGAKRNMNANACEVNSCKHTPGYEHRGILTSLFTVNMLLFFIYSHVIFAHSVAFVFVLCTSCETHFTCVSFRFLNKCQSSSVLDSSNTLTGPFYFYFWIPLETRGRPEEEDV